MRAQIVFCVSFIMPSLTSSTLLTETTQIQFARLNSAKNWRETVYQSYRKETLHELNLLLTSQNPDLATKLADFLAKKWTLINGTLLSYTALPDDELTTLFINIAKYVKQNSPIYRSWPILTILMPTVAVESLSDDYPSLDSIEDIQHVLQTHILGRNGAYLIPVKQLITLQQTHFSTWFNNYYYHEFNSGQEDRPAHSPAHDESMARLNDEEYRRLTQHSAKTFDLDEAKNQYEQSQKDRGSLLDKLEELYQQMYMNSQQVLGVEYIAGEGLYLALIKFNKYYSKLGRKKLEIPAETKRAIEYLLALSSDKRANYQATENVQTCVDTRRGDLRSTIDRNKETLALIGINDHSKSAQAEQTLKNWKKCQDVLEKALNDNNSQGYDKLGFSVQLLNHLKVNFKIQSRADLIDLMRLSLTDITTICECNVDEIKKQFKDIHDFVAFAQETPIEKWQALLAVAGTALIKKLVNNQLGHFNAMLVSLDVTRCEYICEYADPFLQNRTAYELSELFKILSPEKTKILITSLGTLPKLNSAHQVEVLLEYLTPENRTLMYQKIRHLLPDIITNIVDVVRILHYLPPEQQREAFDTFRTDKKTAYICNSVKTPYEFNLLLKHLSAPFRTEIYKEHKNKLGYMIRNTNDFRQILEYLSEEERSEVYHTCFLKSFITGAESFSLVMEFLPQAQQILLYHRYKAMLLSRNLTSILKHLSPDLIETVYQDLEKTYDETIANKMFQVVTDLPPAQTKALLVLMKTKLPLRNAHGELWLTQPLIDIKYKDNEIQKQFIEIYTGTCSDMITSPAILRDLMNRVPENYISDFLTPIKSQIIAMIRSVDDFDLLLRGLNFKQTKFLCNMLKEHLTKWIPIDQFEVKLNGYASIPIETLQGWMFDGLLRELDELTAKFGNDNHSQRKQEAANIFKDHLYLAVEDYFSIERPTQDDLDNFKLTCQKSISPAQAVLKVHREWYEFFAKLALAIVSVGIIPAALIIANKINTGQWEYRLFKTNSEKTLDKFTDALNRVTV